MSILDEGKETADRMLDSETPAGAAIESADQRALVRAKPNLTTTDLKELVEFGEVVARSKFFGDMQSTAQAVVKLSIGRELGLTKTASLTSIYVFQTKKGTQVMIGGAVLLAKINTSPDYRAEVVRSDTTAAWIQPWKRGGLFGTGDKFAPISPRCFFTQGENVCESGVIGGKRCPECAGSGYVPVKFTIDDAKRMGLLVKDNWQSDPEAMIFWRCLSKTQRKYFPDVLAIGPAYLEDELEEINIQQALATAGAATVTLLKPRRASEAPPANAIDLPGTFATDAQRGGPETCDGNHADPACNDPQCWRTEEPLDVEIPPAAPPPSLDELELCQGGKVINRKCDQCNEKIDAATTGEKICPKCQSVFRGLFCPKCLEAK